MNKLDNMNGLYMKVIQVDNSYKRALPHDNYSQRGTHSLSSYFHPDRAKAYYMSWLTNKSDFSCDKNVDGRVGRDKIKCGKSRRHSRCKPSFWNLSSLLNLQTCRLYKYFTSPWPNYCFVNGNISLFSKL